MRMILGALVAILMLAGAARADDAPVACAADLPWGEPIVADASHKLDILCRTAYVTALDESTQVPAWVAWRLTKEHALGCLPRKNQFATDPDAPAGHRVTPADYAKAGFDRGHLAPDADMAWDAEVMRQSFLMTNMSPQAPHLNEWQWEEGEVATRAWAVARGELIVMDGPIYEGDIKRFSPDQIAEPTAFWKVIVDPAAGAAVALIMDNVEIPKGPLQPFAVSVAEVERRAGLSIPLPAAIDKAAVTAPWAFEPSSFTKAKKAACSPG